MDPCGATTLWGQEAAEDTVAKILIDAGSNLRLRTAIEQPTVSHSQKQAVELAVHLGYYDVPRRINLRALAAHMGVTHGNVSELLRRAEQQIITGHCDQNLRRIPSPQRPG